MSAKSRHKHQLAQKYKHGFKPQIPDGSDEDEEVFDDTLHEFSEQLDEVLMTTGDSINGGSTAVSEKKAGNFALAGSRFVAIFAFLFRFAWRIAAWFFTKAKNMQKSYVESISTEHSKEESTAILSQKSEPEVEKNLPNEDPVFVEQVEATSRQLAELHRNPVPVPAASLKKYEKAGNDLAGEEDSFGEDDFDEAVRKARMKLVAAAALVFFCVGGFFAYQFASSRLSKGTPVATEEGRPANSNENTDDGLEDDDDFFTVPIIGNSPVPLIAGEGDFAETAIPQLDDLPDAWELPSTELVLQGDEESLGSASDESVIASQMEKSPMEKPASPAFSLNPGRSLSLSASAGPRDTNTQRTAVPQTMQGETHGATITLPGSTVAHLPLPKTDSSAHMSSPAAILADKYREDDENQEKGLDLFEEEPAPVISAPNRPYQSNIEVDTVTLMDDSTIQTSSKGVRRSRTLPFERSRTQTASQAQTAAFPVKTLAARNQTDEQSENRQYAVQDGDNLFNIAKRQLGDVTRWREIQRLNRDTIGANVQYLTPGTVIFMPE